MARHQHGRLRVMAIALLFAVSGAPANAQQPVPEPAPGFRPHSAEANTFLSVLGSSVVGVLPTVVRSPQGLEYAPASQELAAQLINDAGIARAVVGESRVDLGPTPHGSQWEIFQAGMAALARAIRENEPECDYLLLTEIVMPPGPPAVFGIHVYILDREGRNAFSFLLNSHHQPFRDARLAASDRSAEALAAMLDDAVRLGVSTLEAQLHAAAECAAWMADHPAATVTPGVFADFETELSAGVDPYGVPLGFSTFSDDRSRAEIALTPYHPSREGEAPENTSLKLDLDLLGWAGFAHLFHDAARERWVPQDWTAFHGLSFWMYGRNTGVDFFVDIMDNRSPCSTSDDAERYTWRFADDFVGWRQVLVPFDEMVRKEIWNGAPDDGLNLDRVHGWALGAVDNRAGGTWYLDDVALRVGDTDRAPTHVAGAHPSPR